MKKYIVTLFVLCLATGCSNTKTTGWVLSGSRTDLIARVGLEIQEDGVLNHAEAGIVVKYGDSDEIKWEPEIAGGYLLFHLTQDVTIEDTPSPSPIGPILEALHARPYAGLEIVGNTDSRVRNVQPNWIFGSRFGLSPDSSMSLVTEYSDGDQAAGDVYIGLRLAY